MKTTFSLVCGAVIIGLVGGTLCRALEPVSRAQATLPGLEKRFADPNHAEVPSFQRHISPLLGRLGCNGRACHGSFQGRGGFALSLFGYDFQADYQAIRQPGSGRLDLDDSDASLLISKPVDADIHEGGQRFDLDSWPHRVLRNWIAGGAPGGEPQIEKLDRLEVVPGEVVFDRQGQQQRLQVIAHWQDGSREDVTEISRFTSNDDAIATVTDVGLVTSGDPGDTHIVVAYDKAVVAVATLRPVSELTGDRYPEVTARTAVDELVVQKLRKLGVVPAALCDDTDFLRRVRLNLTGTLPAATEVMEFQQDTTGDKRAALVDRLLQTPEYAAWWATRMSDWTGNNEAQLNNVLPVRGVASQLWFAWLQHRLRQNIPYDQMVAGIVQASTSAPGESYLEYCQRMTRICQPGNAEQYAEHEGLPWYWARRNFRTTDERAIGFSHAFLGIQIECAQCHKHPFDQWSKEDFQQFGKLFQPISVAAVGGPTNRKVYQQLIAELGLEKLSGGDRRREMQTLLRKGKTVPFPELLVRGSENPSRPDRRSGRNVATGRLLGADGIVRLDSDPRDELMDWLRSPDNPYFAKAVVNRVWDNYFGRGIVQPTDDMNLGNPPVNGPLLDYLSRGFIENGFDLHWLHREIILSDTYQRSWEANDSNALDRKNFSRFIPHRLPAEPIYDAVTLATSRDEKGAQIRQTLDGRAIAGQVAGSNRGQLDFTLSVFGASIRESNCDCDRSGNPSLLQSLYLRNDQQVHGLIKHRDGWVAAMCRQLDVPIPRMQPADRAATLDDSQRQRLKQQLASRQRQLKGLNDRQRERAAPRLEKEIKRLRQQLGLLAEQADASENRRVQHWYQEQTEERQSRLHEAIDDAYLRTLSRQPETAEFQRSLAFVLDSESVAEGLEGVLWTLINTKEFVLNH